MGLKLGFLLIFNANSLYIHSSWSKKFWMDRLIKSLLAQWRSPQSEDSPQLKLSAEEAKEARKLKQVWDWSGDFPENPPSFDTASNFQKFQTRIAQEKQVPAKVRFLSGWRAAAAVLLLATVGVWLFSTFSANIGSKSSLAVSNKQDQPLQVDLQDGSIVTLYPGASLEYPRQINASSSREVILQGKGHFDVYSNPEKPFIIHTAATKVEVLGTQFYLEERADSKSTTISVTEGLVSFTDKSTGEQIKVPTASMGICKEGGLLYESSFRTKAEETIPYVFKSRGGSLLELRDWLADASDWVMNFSDEIGQCEVSGNFDAQNPQKVINNLRNLGYVIEQSGPQSFRLSGGCQ